MNHGFVSAKKDFDPEVVDAEIRRIAHEVFLDAFQVTRSETNEGLWWQVAHHVWWGYGCSVWLQTKRKLTFRRASGGELSFWIQHALQSGLAKRCSGRISDEGVSGSWAWDHELLPTWKSCFDALYGHCPEMASKIWDEQTAKLSPELLKLALAK